MSYGNLLVSATPQFCCAKQLPLHRGAKETSEVRSPYSGEPRVTHGIVITQREPRRTAITCCDAHSTPRKPAKYAPLAQGSRGNHEVRSPYSGETRRSATAAVSYKKEKSAQPAKNRRNLAVPPVGFSGTVQSRSNFTGRRISLKYADIPLLSYKLFIQLQIKRWSVPA